MICISPEPRKRTLQQGSPPRFVPQDPKAKLSLFVRVSYGATGTESLLDGLFSTGRMMLKRGRISCPFAATLFAKAKLLDQGTIALDVLLLEILKKAAAMADHLKKAASGMMVLLVHLKVLGKLVDPGRKPASSLLRSFSFPPENCFPPFLKRRLEPPTPEGRCVSAASYTAFGSIPWKRTSRQQQNLSVKRKSAGRADGNVHVCCFFPEVPRREDAFLLFPASTSPPAIAKPLTRNRTNSGLL